MYEKLKNWPIYPFLFAFYPILFLLANNASEVRPNVSIRALVLALLCTLLLLALFRLIKFGREAASLMTTLVVVVLLSYGHLYHGLRDLIPGGSQIIRHRFLLPAVIILFIFTLWIIRRNKNKLSSITQYMNVISLVLIVMPIFQILQSEVRYQKAFNARSKSDSSSCNLSVPAGKAVPDIYLIILDAYTRDDILVDTYNFDNEPFLEELRELGFNIAEMSQSNYASTIPSLTSSLNMEYLIDHSGESLVPNVGINQDGIRNFSIVNSGVRKVLECLGYIVVSFDSGLPYTSWHNADYYFSPHKIGWERYYLSGTNEFESMLINSSIGLLIIDTALIRAEMLQGLINNPYSEHGERILFALEIDGTGVLNLPSPKFVFIHIVSPHTPFIFSVRDEFVDQTEPFTLFENEDNTLSENHRGYRDQVDFINVKVLKMVRDIMDASEIPPIIIIQGDHGSSNSIRDRMAILNAYHLPDGGDQMLYESITPVNSFRIIFNYYFGGTFTLLEDQSYFSDHDDVYNFIKVQNFAD